MKTVPDIRFKGFEEDEWKKKQIGEIGYTYSGLTGKTKSDFGIGDCLYITFLNVLNNAIINSSILEKVNVCIDEKQNKVCRGDILFNTSSETPEEVGMCAAVDEELIDVYLNSFCFGLRITDKEIDSLFFAYLMRSNIGRKIMKFLAQGATRYNLSKNNFYKTKLLLPETKSEQYQIASYFRQLDIQISEQEKRIVKLKQLKSACLSSMFPQQGETVPRVRFKGFEDEWKKKQIGEIGYTYSGLTGKTKSDFGIGDCLYITFLNVLNNAIINSSILEKVNVCIDEKQNKVCRGDILFNTSSETPEEVGMCAAVDEELIDVYLNSFCFGLRITDKEIDSLFFAYLMRSNIGRKIMKFLAQGATRYNLSKNNFYKTKLLLPETKSEQHQIASYFHNLDIQISEQEKRLEKLKQIKAACLDKMFV